MKKACTHPVKTKISNDGTYYCYGCRKYFKKEETK